MENINRLLPMIGLGKNMQQHLLAKCYVIMSEVDWDLSQWERNFWDFDVEIMSELILWEEYRYANFPTLS